MATASNQPQRQGRPVTAPNSLPLRAISAPVSSNNSVVNGPPPTRVQYALMIPHTESRLRGPKPEPGATPPAVVLELVTYG